jgi:hypothetical protein
MKPVQQIEVPHQPTMMPGEQQPAAAAPRETPVENTPAAPPAPQLTKPRLGLFQRGLRYHIDYYDAEKTLFELQAVAISENELQNDMGEIYEFPPPEDCIIKSCRLVEETSGTAGGGKEAITQHTGFGKQNARITNKIYTLREACAYAAKHGEANLRLALRETYHVEPAKQQFRDRDIEKLVSFLVEQSAAGTSVDIICNSEHARNLLIDIQVAGAKALGKDPTTMRHRLEKDTFGTNPFLNALSACKEDPNATRESKNGGRGGNTWRNRWRNRNHDRSETTTLYCANCKTTTHNTASCWFRDGRPAPKPGAKRSH